MVTNVQHSVPEVGRWSFDMFFLIDPDQTHWASESLLARLARRATAGWPPTAS